MAEFVTSHFEKLSLDNISSDDNSTTRPYNFEFFRLLSFEKWPRDSFVFPIRLAEAGFYYKGTSDTVQCNFCKAEKQGWNKGNNPRKVHALLNPSCPFLRNPENTDNIPVGTGSSGSLSGSFSRISSLLESENRFPNSPTQEPRDQSLEHQEQTNNPREAPQPQEYPREENQSFPLTQERFNNRVPGRSSAPIGSVGRSGMSDSNQTPQQFRLALVSGDEGATSSLPARLSGGSSKGRSGQPNQSPQPLMLQEDPGILRFERNRLETFRDWPTNAPVSPKDLAKSGFYYTGTEDRVQCVFCRGILKDWDVGDKPHIEHRNKFPRCPFLLGVDVGNVSHTPSQPAHQQYQPVYRGGDYVNQPQSNMAALGISTDRPKHPNYAVEATRVTSFRGWPQYRHQTPEQLAKAGFFYAGFNDNVKCFFCDGGLRNWETGDDPWTEHARWFPKCSYLKSVKGESFITSIQDKFNTGQAQGHRVDPREVRARMETPIVRAVLEIGMNRSTVMRALEQRLTETGDDFPNAQELLNAVLNLEENPDAMNVETVTQAPPQDEEVSPVAGPSSDFSQPSSSAENYPPNNTGSGSSLEEENRKLREQKTCKICMDEDVGVVFLPCGHLCCCVNCAPAIIHCPICRTPIKGSVRTYIP